MVLFAALLTVCAILVTVVPSLSLLWWHAILLVVCMYNAQHLSDSFRSAVSVYYTNSLCIPLLQQYLCSYYDENGDITSVYSLETVLLLWCWHVWRAMVMWWMNYWQQSVWSLTNWVGSVSAYLSISTTVEGNDECGLLPSEWRDDCIDHGQQERSSPCFQEANQSRSNSWYTAQGGYTSCHTSLLMAGIVRNVMETKVVVWALFRDVTMWVNISNDMYGWWDYKCTPLFCQPVIHKHHGYHFS